MTGVDPLSRFHPIIREWFSRRVGEPTEIQRQAWPRIAAGEHTLVVAPTGSGKTLAAFLWALDNLLTGAWERGAVRVLYVSPLRALNTDIRRNLSRPLEELSELFRRAGADAPVVRVATRSGDTPTAERRRMIRQPPEILITTPESLNILLTSRSGRILLGHLETVILDEIHAVASSKRGTHLLTAVERVVGLSGEFQRIALSATVRPAGVVAELVGGYRLERREGMSNYLRRIVTIICSKEEKKLDISVRFALAGNEHFDDDSSWRAQITEYKLHIRRNRSTLLFANSRRLAEKVVRLINDGEPQELAYSHHGSLSREVREIVERRLKNGELKAIVATSSLELGIDIGSLDEVIMVRSPTSVASAVQRVGRAGHSVGAVSRGTFYPTDGRDLLDAAVVARATSRHEIEESRPLSSPLDVLAQVVLSMTVADSWDLDELFDSIRCATPYRRLDRRQFDLVIEMLAGRYEQSKVRELRPRIVLDRVRGTVKARRGVERLLYMSGGTIADRGYFSLRVQDTKAKLGELDEEFVWERSIGDSFNLGAQSWQIQRITHNDVLVSPTRSAGSLAPFWRADRQDRSFFLGSRTLRLLAVAEQRINDADWLDELCRDYCLDRPAAKALAEFLREQIAATRYLPTADRIVAERFRDRSAELGSSPHIAIHTFWGGTVNRPLALALRGAWKERFGEVLETYHDDSSLLLKPNRDISVAELLAMVSPGQLESLLRDQLEHTGYFGARFRVSAAISLLLPKAGFRQRTPLWVSRQRSKKLLESVASFGDFPILLETWRACLKDEMQLDRLREQLTRLDDGEIDVHEAVTETPSPFCAGLVWLDTNEQMYATDEPTIQGSGIADEVLRDLVLGAHLRPRLPADLVRAFEQKIRRMKPGYLPRDQEEMLEWVKERLMLDVSEWRSLLSLVENDRDLDSGAVIDALADRMVRLRFPGATIEQVVAVDRLPWLLKSTGTAVGSAMIRSLADDSPPVLLAEWLAGASAEWSSAESPGTNEDLGRVLAEVLTFCGPVPLSWIEDRFGSELGSAGTSDPDLARGELQRALDDLRENHRVVVDVLTDHSESLEICDTENLEILLRWLRQQRRPVFEPLDLARLPLWLAWHQGLANRGGSLVDLQARLEQLFGFPAPAEMWEREFLPARLETYYPSWLDSLFHESPLMWLGCGRGCLTFMLEEDLDLFASHEGKEEDGSEDLFPSSEGHYQLEQLAVHAGSTLADTNERVWQLAWQGRVANDGFLAVRRSIETKFRSVLPTKAVSSARHERRIAGLARRWRSRSQNHGRWYAVPEPTFELDALDRDDLSKERARVVLHRHGIVFRELLARELPDFRWQALFRTLRLMELSGEIVAGHFFGGARGLQFMTKGAFEELRKGIPEDLIFWLNATDPASLCGTDIEGLEYDLPARRPGNHVVYHGSSLVLVSERKGRRLRIEVDSEHPRICDYLGVLGVALTREVSPQKRIDIEEINGRSAIGSPYEKPLGELFSLTREASSIRLWRRF